MSASKQKLECFGIFVTIALVNAACNNDTSSASVISHAGAERPPQSRSKVVLPEAKRVKGSIDSEFRDCPRTTDQFLKWASVHKTIGSLSEVQTSVTTGRAILQGIRPAWLATSLKGWLENQTVNSLIDAVALKNPGPIGIVATYNEKPWGILIDPVGKRYATLSGWFFAFDQVFGRDVVLRGQCTKNALSYEINWRSIGFGLRTRPSNTVLQALAAKIDAAPSNIDIDKQWATMRKVATKVGIELSDHHAYPDRSP